MVYFPTRNLFPANKNMFTVPNEFYQAAFYYYIEFEAFQVCPDQACWISLMRSYMIGDVISRENNHSTISSKYAFRSERDLIIYKRLLPISV